MPQTGTRKDHNAVGFFKIELEGVEAGSFRKCSGLKVETDIFEFQEGGDNEGVRKLVGQTKYSNIILTKGFVNDPALWNWRQTVATSGSNKIDRRNGSIIALSADGKTELSRWNFQRGWPVRWEMTEWDSASGQAACEILEIAIEKVVKG